MKASEKLVLSRLLVWMFALIEFYFKLKLVNSIYIQFDKLFLFSVFSINLVEILSFSVQLKIFCSVHIFQFWSFKFQIWNDSCLILNYLLEPFNFKIHIFNEFSIIFWLWIKGSLSYLISNFLKLNLVVKFFNCNLVILKNLFTHF